MEFEVKLDKIVGGGQALGTLENGKKIFVWGGLPGETVRVRITKKKSKYLEGVVTDVLEPSSDRVTPEDPDSYLSTSPWQIMDFALEQRTKANLIDEAFALHHVTLPHETNIFTDNNEYHYRNKVEFSWYGQQDEDQVAENTEKLDLAFFRRGSKGKIIVSSMSLARPEIMTLALAIRDLLQSKGIHARQLKTLLIRCNQTGECAWQLYTKEKLSEVITPSEAKTLPARGGEIIFSDPRSPASRISERLASFGDIVLTDTILDVPFRYATEGFFQVNIPVYERALEDMREHVQDGTETHFLTQHLQPEFSLMRAQGESGAKPVVEESAVKVPSDSDLRSDVKDGTYDRSEHTHVIDLYSGVGTIGLTIGGDNCTLIEIDEHAVREMRRNIAELDSNAEAILAASENAVEYITSDAIVIVDPPRAGLHQAVIDHLLDVTPPRIIYLSCNPVTQARDVALLLDKYQITHTQGYNFFPRTPHIEHLVVLDRS